MLAEKEITRKRQPQAAAYLGEAAIYSRQSRTDDSKKAKALQAQSVETTLKTQTGGGLKEAARRGYHVADSAIYEERYTGAELWDRPLLTRLRADIRAGKYKALICHSTDRLAREPIHLGLIAEECARAGCELIFVTEPLDDSPEGQLILFVRGYASKIERYKLKERVQRGRSAILAAGKLLCSGTPPYGYTWNTETRTREINMETASVVMSIFRWTVEGVSAQQIAKKLNALRVPSPAAYYGRKFKRSGVPVWNNSAVSRILKDETYTGVTYANKFRVTEKRHKATGRMFTELRDKSEWLTLPEGVTPQIITRELYDAARTAVQANIRKSDNTRNRNRPFLLRGVAFCGRCEHPLYPMSESTYNGPARGVYKCSCSRSKLAAVSPDKVCRAKRIIASEIEAAVWEKVLTFFMQPELIAAEVEKVLSEMPDDNLSTDLAAAQAQLEKTKRVRDKMLAKYREAVAEDDEDLAEQFEASYKEANSDVKALTAVIDDLSARLSAYNNAATTARAFQDQCAQVLDGMKGEFTFEEKRAALTALNVRVFAHTDMPTKIRLNTGVVLQTAAGLKHNSRDLTIEITL